MACSGVPSAFWQEAQRASGASPMRCLYVGSDVWWPERSRARYTRSSRGRCSSVESMWVAGSHNFVSRRLQAKLSLIFGITCANRLLQAG